MSGFRHMIMTEIPEPLCVRRTVSFCEAIYTGATEVEGVWADYAANISLIDSIWNRARIPVLVDPEWSSVASIKPDVIVDATMVKRNIGTRMDEARLVIGVGPGFTAGDDVHMVIESNRGHDLGRVIYSGTAEPYTGVPGSMMGYGKERVLRAPVSGQIKHFGKIGDIVKKDDPVLKIGDTTLLAPIDGVLRGLIREIVVDKGEKVGDIDPTGIIKHCYTITEKARAIGGGVLEAVMHVHNNPFQIERSN
ncbi:MAG TPA: selenium-dependent molybdenum cofactor biosynthesis protein YqeB [Syntrophorhabdaceae bacterium]|nr:selenium-dependent molybdenum cofactor biosynthesis protein YqeB [Syntrophorhabdaceae bacterium]